MWTSSVVYCKSDWFYILCSSQVEGNSHYSQKKQDRELAVTSSNELTIVKFGVVKILIWYHVSLIHAIAKVDTTGWLNEQRARLISLYVISKSGGYTTLVSTILNWTLPGDIKWWCQDYQLYRLCMVRAWYFYLCGMDIWEIYSI